MKKFWGKKGNELLKEIRNTKLCEDETALWYIGQSGFLFKHDDLVIAIDPVLNDLKDAQGNSRRFYEPPFEPNELFVDVVLCTHGHRDHYAKEAIRGLYEANPEIKIIVPKGMAPVLIEDGFSEKNILPLNENEMAKIKGAAISGFSLAHPTIEKDSNGNDMNLGYELHFNNWRAVHLGDTYLCEKLVDHLKEMKGIDLLIAPINGQDYFRTARNCIGNLSAYEAVMAGKIADAKEIIPCHYDTIMGNTCSVSDFIVNMETHYGQGCFSIPRLGQRLIFKKENYL